MIQRLTSEIESFGITHVGKVREDNQDSIRLCNPDDEFTPVHGHLYGIADGMGGYAHGAVASTLALTTFFDSFYAIDGSSIPRKLRIGVQNANISVYQKARQSSVGKMGTTLTSAHLWGRTLHIAHVGDSRAYLIRDNASRCLTNDHTRVGELVRMRVLSPDKVRSHYQRSILNRSVGLDVFVQPDIVKHTVVEGDTLVLCSDGVWAVIEDHEFAAMKMASTGAEQLGRKIFDTALSRESDDNLSVIVLYLHHLVTPAKIQDRRNHTGLMPRFLKRLVRGRRRP